MEQFSSKSCRPGQVPRSEEILERYYGPMQDWALGLTRGDVEKAEDIVHDLCLDLTLTKTELSGIENIEGYLYTCLRHLYLSQLAHSSREAVQSIQTSEFDFVRVALWAQPDGDPLRLQNELRQICNYALWRKASTKNASYFILRFFHGYSLPETADRACVPLVAIYDKLSKARSDVQAYLDEPKEIQLATHNSPPPPDLRWSPVSSVEFFRELREQILSARVGDCLSEKALLAPYLTLSPKPLSCAALSHLVSCERCLRVVDLCLGRPNGNNKTPSGDIRPVAFSKSGKRQSGTHGTRGPARGRQAVLREVSEHYQYTYDHRPRKLSLAVDGKIVASHTIRARESELSARMERPENAHFVEVFSDQGLRLAYVPVEPRPPEGPSQQARRVELSDGRWMQLTLTFDGMGLDSVVKYFDPILPPEILEEANEESSPEDTADRDDTNPFILPAKDVTAEAIIDRPNPHRGCRRPFRSLATWWQSTASKLKQMLMPNVSPLLATAAVFGCVSILCFFAWMQDRPKITADALLRHAEKWDVGGSGNTQPGIIYQKVRIKTSNRTLDRAIYRDAQGRRRPKQQQLSADDALLRSKLAVAGVNWDEPLSASTYKNWYDHQQIQNDVVARTGKDLLTLTSSTAPGSNVAQETLTVRESDFHPVDRTVKLRDGNTFEIAELNYDVMPWGAGSDGWFEPSADSELNPALRLPPSTLRLPVQPTEAELDEAELSARLVLNQLHADSGEQIEIIRDPSAIVVKGIVETEQRQHELGKRLSMLPYVITSISSIEDLKTKPLPTGGEVSSLKVLGMQTQTTPLETYYRTHGRDLTPLSRLSQQLSNSADAINFESKSIDDLQLRFARRDSISLIASATLSDLLYSHKYKLLGALEEEKHLLAEAQIEAVHSKPKAPAAGADVALEALAERNLALTRELALSNGGGGRAAELIAFELAASIDELSRHAHAAQVAPQNFTSSDKRK